MEQLLNSGLSIKDSLEIISLMDKKKKDDNISSIILEKIQKGNSFADAVNSLPEIFSSVYRGIIAVGDRVGSVEKIFPRLRIYLETQKKIKDKLISSIIYPSMVIITVIITFISMLAFVFPKLKIMFAEFGGEAAVILENNITKLEACFYSLIILIICCIISILLFNLFSIKNKSLKLLKDSFLLRLPVIGRFIVYLETLNFSFAMETLTAGGITIENAISEAKAVVSNEKYKKSLEDVNQRIIRGELLSEAFSLQTIFPEYMSKWIIVSEKSGKPEQVFSQIRNYFQNEIDQYTTRFMALIEPSLIILVGILLIILVITVIVPIFSLYGSIL